MHLKAVICSQAFMAYRLLTTTEWANSSCWGWENVLMQLDSNVACWIRVELSLRSPSQDAILEVEQTRDVQIVP